MQPLVITLNAIALAATLYGDAGLKLVAIALVVMVPIANASCIAVMEYALPREMGASAWTKLAAVFKNPKKQSYRGKCQPQG